MTAIQFVLIAIAAFIVLAGLFMVIRSFKRRNGAEAAAVNYDKNGIPIIPRHERNIVDQPDFDDTVAGETSIGPDRTYLNAVVEEEPLTQTHTNVDPQLTAERDTMADEDHDVVDNEDYARWQEEQRRADNAEFLEAAEQMHIEQEPDAFSSLMSATDSLMPSIDTAEEPSFDNNSPILDQHLSESGDDAQNGPLDQCQRQHQYHHLAAPISRSSNRDYPWS
ncbi:hypothetical protein PKHYL_05740 [Psychrobacter sp. KH172YL61]|uniref:hypothetical protein n=1 Tax=Psychrobacter sp. KH172YL61 TaxID=2517899 RepID=UPI0010B6515A|nr:hypothetical protein [Psychrobacter sp. KH172YL61]BBI66383.1 hypothetical protein PKHYL_05740 [Psychrobacter sp. KH172YL61]